MTEDVIEAEVLDDEPRFAEDGVTLLEVGPEGLTDEQYDLVRERTVAPKAKIRRELSRPVGEDGELSGLDARLLEMAAAHRSPEEMGDELGLSPARAAQRVKEIIQSRDWLSLAEQEMLLMDEMVELKEKLKALIARFDDADYLQGLDPRYIAMLQKVMTDLMRGVEQRRKAAQGERVSIRASHAKLVVAAIERAFSLLMRELSAKYEVDEVVARDLMEAAIPRAIEMLQESSDGKIQE